MIVRGSSLLSRVVTKRAAVAGEKLIAIYGQSNIGMSEPIANLQSDLLASISTNFIWNFNASPKAWEVLTTSNNEGDIANTHTNTFGIEFRLMKLLHDNYGGSQFIIKHGQSSTQLASTGDSTLDWGYNSSSSGALELFDKTILNRIYAKDRIPVNLDESWVIWIQGENDCGNATNSSNYQTNITNWINTYRTQTGLGTACKFILVSLSTGQTSLNSTNRSTINSGMSAAAGALTNVFYYSQNNGTSDGTHYDATSIDNIAQGVYDIIAAN